MGRIVGAASMTARATPTTAAQRPGLVPSINKSETTCAPLEGFVVEKLEARCTRLRKNLGVSAKLQSQGSGQAYMLTFTYRDDAEWHPKQISETLASLRKWLWREHKARLRYMWVIETKRRLSGSMVGEFKPHYHCIVWVPLAVTMDDLKLDTRGYWRHGMTNVVKAVAPVKYVMKYVSKFDSEAAFPKGARCYGIGGLDDVGVRVRRWINWPSFVQARASIADSYGRAPGGGWVNRVTGEWWPSEFALSYRTKTSAAMVRVHTHERPIANVRGPFSWRTPACGVH